MSKKNNSINGKNNERRASHTDIDVLTSTWHVFSQTSSKQKIFVELNDTGHRVALIDVYVLESQRVFARGVLVGPDDGSRVELFYDLEKIIQRQSRATEIDYQLFSGDRMIEVNFRS